MWIKKLLASLALLSVLLTAPSQAADLELNGVAVYSYLTREYYLGGLYLPKRSDDPKYIRSDAINKRMQLVVRVSLGRHGAGRTSGKTTSPSTTTTSTPAHICKMP